MIKAIIFDWGGVLAPDATDFIANVFSVEKGISKEELKKEFSKLEDEYSSGDEYKQFYDRLAEKFNIPANVIMDTHNSVKPWEVLDIARKMKKKGYIVAILSNQMKTRTDTIRTCFDISFFDYLFFSNEVGMMKPNKDFFEYALKKMNLKAEDCVFIDDRAYNIDAAKKLGFKTILFESIDQFKKAISKLLK